MHQPLVRDRNIHLSDNALDDGRVGNVDLAVAVHIAEEEALAGAGLGEGSSTIDGVAVGDDALGDDAGHVRIRSGHRDDAVSDLASARRGNGVLGNDQDAVLGIELEAVVDLRLGSVVTDVAVSDPCNGAGEVREHGIVSDDAVLIDSVLVLQNSGGVGLARTDVRDHAVGDRLSDIQSGVNREGLAYVEGSLLSSTVDTVDGDDRLRSRLLSGLGSGLSGLGRSLSGLGRSLSGLGRSLGGFLGRNDGAAGIGKGGVEVDALAFLNLTLIDDRSQRAVVSNQGLKGGGDGGAAALERLIGGDDQLRLIVIECKARAGGGSVELDVAVLTARGHLVAYDREYLLGLGDLIVLTLNLIDILQVSRIEGLDTVEARNGGTGIEHGVNGEGIANVDLLDLGLTVRSNDGHAQVGGLGLGGSLGRLDDLAGRIEGALEVDGLAGLDFAAEYDLGHILVGCSQDDQVVGDIGIAVRNNLVGGGDKLGILSKNEGIRGGRSGSGILDDAVRSIIDHGVGAGHGELSALKRENLGAELLGAVHAGEAGSGSGSVQSGVDLEGIAYVEALDLFGAVEAVDGDLSVVDVGNGLLKGSDTREGLAGLYLTEVNDLGVVGIRKSEVSHSVLDLSGAGCGYLIGGDHQLSGGVVKFESLRLGGSGRVVADNACGRGIRDRRGAGDREYGLNIRELTVLAAVSIDQRELILGVSLGTLDGADQTVRSSGGNVESGIDRKLLAYGNLLDLSRTVETVDRDGSRLCGTGCGHAYSKHCEHHGEYQQHADNLFHVNPP